MVQKKHRISWTDTAGTPPTVLWGGEDEPTASDVAAGAEYVRTRINILGHDAFQQASADVILVERRKRLGWRAVDAFNVYDV